MFQFLRRMSGSLLPRPDRPWGDDATSHAPTIGRKRRYSATIQDGDDSPASTVKRPKNDPIMLDEVEEGSTEGDIFSPRDVKEVTKGVKEVDLDKDRAQDSSSIRPEGIPLPDSPSPSPSPSPSLAKSDVPETQGEEHGDGEDSVDSSSSEDDAEEGAKDTGTEAEPGTADPDASADGTKPAQPTSIEAVELGPHDTSGTLEVKE